MCMKMSQKQISSLVGCSPRHLNRVLKRKTSPSVKLAQKLESVTGIHWTTWYENTPEPDVTREKIET